MSRPSVPVGLDSAKAAPGPEDLLDTSAAGPTAIRGGILRGAGYALALLLSAVSVPLLVRHLGLVDFGRYVLVTALITLVAGVTEGGLQIVGTREWILRDRPGRERLMRSLLGVRLFLSTTGVTLAVLFTLVAGYDGVLVVGTAVAGVGLVFQSVQNLLTVPLAGQLRLGWVTLLDLLRQSTVVTLTIGLIVLGASLLPFLAAMVPAALLSAVLTALLVRRLTSFRPTFDRAEWWMLVRDTVPYAAAIAVNVAYFRLAIVIMSLLAPALETGYFAASFRVLEVLLPVPAVVVGAVFPILARAARDDVERLAYASQRIFDVGLIAGAGLGLLLGVAAPFVIEVLAGEAGDPAIAVLRIQAPALLATFVAVACGFSLLSLRRHREILAVNLAALLVSVALTVALVPLLGARGAAVATTSAEFTLAAVTLVVLVRAHDALRPSLRLVPRVAAAASLALGGLLVPVPAVVQAAIAGGLYVVALLGLKAVPAELLAAMPRPRRG